MDPNAHLDPLLDPDSQSGFGLGIDEALRDSRALQDEHADLDLALGLRFDSVLNAGHDSESESEFD